jgi:membrane-associated phospholipid phosphatase
MSLPLEHDRSPTDLTPTKVSFSSNCAGKYAFIDYATQLYLLVVMVLILVFHNHTVPHWPRLVLIHVANIVLIHLLVRFTPRLKSRLPGLLAAILDFLRHFYPVLMYAWFYSETGLINRMFIRQYLDPGLINLEQTLFGCQPSIALMDRLPYLPISELFYAAYFSYYVMIGGVGFALLVRNKEHFFHYVSVVSFLFYVCYLIYIAIPIIGPPIFYEPIDGFQLSQPWQQLAANAPFPESIKSGLFFRLMAWIYRVFESPGAAFPSSHVAIAICTVFFSFQYLRRIRYVHLAVAVLLCVATVYCRYHYVVDVFAGILVAGVLIPAGNALYFRLNERS